MACNKGTTTFELIKKFNVDYVTAIDIDELVIQEAKQTALKKGIASRCEFIVADAKALPFEDESFDVIINEAMLTMMSDQDRSIILKEYCRILKKGGQLLTHDILLKTEDESIQKEIKKEISKAILVNINPMNLKGWNMLYDTYNFREISVLTGQMSLMNPKGMLIDEGFLNTVRIFKNAHQKDNKRQFKLMRTTFKRHHKNLGFYARISVKV